MANNSTAISGLQQKTYADPTDQVVAWSSISNADVIIPVANLFSNSSFSVSNLIISTIPHTPANSTANSTQGQVWFDNAAIYVATSNNNIKKITFKTWSGYDGPPEVIGGSYSGNTIASTYPPASNKFVRGWVGDSPVPANSSTYGTIVTGGGTYTVPVFSDGVGWKIG